MRRVVQQVVLIVALAGAFAAVRYASLREPAPVIDRSSPAWALRETSLKRAQVFLPDARGTSARVSPPMGRDVRASEIDADRPLRCTYVPKPNSGTTPKFDCRLPDGEVVKVKYGNNPEIPAEVAATRLLRSLGFAADHVSLVREVECAGCPPHPFRTRQVAEMLFLASALDRTAGLYGTRRYTHAAVERKFEAEAIEAGDVRGWQWSDLDLVNEAEGGAGRAELDALRLIAVLLAHWDNKPSNQRLVCLDKARQDQSPADAAGCRQPLLMLQDLGATFGPTKLDHANWAATPLWEPGSACIATMTSLPYRGATFRSVAISEAGRRLLGERLSRLSDDDLQALFRGAGFPDAATGAPRASDVGSWVATMRQKIDTIARRPACPSPL